MAKKQITGTGSIALPALRIGAPEPPGTYFGVAESLVPGVRVLAAAGTSCALPLAMVAAHVLECLLKAYLSRDGSDTAVKKKGVRHDLEALWKGAVAAGLAISDSPPDWVLRLASLHREPFHLRYSTNVHGVVLPAAEPMTSDLVLLVDTVRGQIK